MHKYYIRNKNQGYLGNAPFWWGIAGGYTAYLSGAKRFTAQEAKDIAETDTDKFEIWPCEEIDKRLHLVFDSQEFKKVGTIEPCGFYKYADKEFFAPEVEGD